MTDRGSSLAAALADIDRFTEQHMPPWSVIVAAARRSLRLSKIPCENCQGDPHKIDRWTCPSCGGSGEVWPAELVEVVARICAFQWDSRLAKSDLPNVFRGMARAVLDALDLYAKEATK